jgi:hypothetical protein
LDTLPACRQTDRPQEKRQAAVGKQAERHVGSIDRQDIKLASVNIQTGRGMANKWDKNKVSRQTYRHHSAKKGW